MRPVTIALFAATISCGTRSVRDSGGETAPEEPAVEGEASAADEPRRASPAAHLALELAPGGSVTEVRVVITDEVGSTRRERVGTFEGECVDISGEVASDAILLGARCEGGRGVLLHLIHRAQTITVLRDWRDDTEEAFDPILQFDLPAGARVTTDHGR